MVNVSIKWYVNYFNNKLNRTEFFGPVIFFANLAADTCKCIGYFFCAFRRFFCSKMQKIQFIFVGFYISPEALALYTEIEEMRRG